MERHDAIRLGKPYELFTIRRLFKVMGMQPVGYYDLAFYHYFTTDKSDPKGKTYTKADVNQLLVDGYLHIEPMVYEDFLPVSVAGIFASNLGTDDAKREYEGSSNQELFEKDLGAPVNDLVKCYTDMQDRSIE